MVDFYIKKCLFFDILYCLQNVYTFSNLIFYPKPLFFKKIFDCYLRNFTKLVIVYIYKL